MPTTLDAYAPFDSGAGAATMEATWRKFMKHPLQTGVLANILNQFEVYGDSSGRQVKVKSGECWIQGHWGTKTTETTLAIAANSSGSTRTDRVILRANFGSDLIELDVKTGGAAPQQDTSMWEITLATVTVVNGATVINAGDVADGRQRVGLAGGNIEYYQASVQSIATGGVGSPGTKIKFDTAVKTSADIAVTGTGNTDFTVLRAGTWAVNASLGYVSSAVADFYGFIIAPGPIRLASASVTSSTTLTPVLTVSLTKHFNIGDTISIQALHFAGGARDLYRQDQSTRVSMTWISDA